jgi:hypothetical protein
MKEADKDYILTTLAFAWGAFAMCFGLSYFVSYEELKAAALYLGQIYYNSSTSIWYFY